MLVETLRHSVFLFQVWSWGGLLCRKFSGPVNRQNKLQTGMRFHTHTHVIVTWWMHRKDFYPTWVQEINHYFRKIAIPSQYSLKTKCNKFLSGCSRLISAKSLQTRVKIQIFIIICPLENVTLCLWLTANYIFKIMWSHIYSKMTRLTPNAGCNYTKAWRDVSKTRILINSLQNQKL